MAKVKRDEVRENRIVDEIIVDAYGEDEQAMGWYNYLEEKLKFPFTARCINKRSTSPLLVGNEVKVIGMESEDDCVHEMFVKIQWGKRSLGVPVSQLEVVQANDQTQEAVEDWHYWVGMGYQL
ncbi:MAG: calcium-binding protein [Terracidiphilus sp.]|jgi:hypothetical protein